MLPSLVSFGRAIASLRGFLHFQATLDAALRVGSRLPTSERDHEKAMVDLVSAARGTTMKRYLHTVVVMELQGAMEQLVDGLVRDYLTRLTSVSQSPKDLPAVLIEAHTRKSIE